MQGCKRGVALSAVGQLHKVKRFWDHDYVWTTNDRLSRRQEIRDTSLMIWSGISLGWFITGRIRCDRPPSLTERDDSWTSLDQFRVNGLSAHEYIDGHIERAVWRWLLNNFNCPTIGFNNDCQQQTISTRFGGGVERNIVNHISRSTIKKNISRLFNTFYDSSYVRKKL